MGSGFDCAEVFLMTFDRDAYVNSGKGKAIYIAPDPQEAKQLAVKAFECQYMDWLYGSNSKTHENLSTLCATMRHLDYRDKVIIEDNYHSVFKKYPCIDTPEMI